MDYHKALYVTLFILAVSIQPVPAPVPRCSPFIIINKLAETSNLLSDSNPYFPVPPCEYGGWMEAVRAGDYRATFVLAEPHKIPLHNFYEFVWLLKTGAPRIWRFMTGEEEFIMDDNILREGYKHYTRHPRTQQIGMYTQRNPTIIDNKSLYKRIVGDKIRRLFKYGKDKKPNRHYTYQGNLRGRGSGSYSKQHHSSSASGYSVPKTSSSPVSAAQSQSNHYQADFQTSNFDRGTLKFPRAAPAFHTVPEEVNTVKNPFLRSSAQKQASQSLPQLSYESHFQPSDWPLRMGLIKPVLPVLPVQEIEQSLPSSPAESVRRSSDQLDQGSFHYEDGFVPINPQFHRP